MLMANDRFTPWLRNEIGDQCGLSWQLLINMDTGDLDNHLVETAIFHARVNTTVPGPITISATNPGSQFTVLDCVTLSGLGSIDVPIFGGIGWGGPGVDATTGPFVRQAIWCLASSAEHRPLRIAQQGQWN